MGHDRGRVAVIANSLRVLILASLALWSANGAAHQSSTSLWRMQVDGAMLSGNLEVALKDLDAVPGLDADHSFDWGSEASAQERITHYALTHLGIRADGVDCPLRQAGLDIVNHVDGKYVMLKLEAACPKTPEVLQLDYSLLFEVDPQHRGLLQLDLQRPGHKGEIEGGVFAPDAHRLEIQSGVRRPLRVFGQYFRAGLFHVWSGLDHLLFLAGLFLPAVVRRRQGVWVPVPTIGIAIRDTAFIVTAFTLAHACTLTLAATGAFTLPSRLVESAVALTVFFAAFNNLVPMVYRELVWLSGGFGLIHGAAVASALIELGLPAEGRVWALLAFNLGVEAAQLSLLALVIPPTFYFRKSPAYRNWVLLPGSAAVALVGLIWFIERAFAVQLGVPLP